MYDLVNVNLLSIFLWKHNEIFSFLFFFCSILNVSAIVLANLCVSYIMTSQNEEAEELMRKIEKEEEQVVIGKTFSCIVEKKVDLTKKNLILLFSFSACLRGPRQKSVSSMYCQFGNWHPVLCQRKLRIWHFKSH